MADTIFDDTLYSFLQGKLGKYDNGVLETLSKGQESSAILTPQNNVQ